MAFKGTSENSPQSDRTPTLESIQCNIACVADQVRELKSKYEKNEMLSTLLKEMTSLQDENRKLKEELDLSRRDALSTTDASGDAGSTIASLLKENSRLENRVEQLEGNQLQGTAIGGVHSVFSQLSFPPRDYPDDPIDTDSLKVSAPTNSGAQILKAEGSKENVTEGVITEDMIDWITDEVLHEDWKPLARKLGVTDNQLQNIVANHVNNAREQRFESYNLWRQQDRSEATAQKLLEVMEKKGLRSLTREFCKAFRLDLEQEPDKCLHKG